MTLASYHDQEFDRYSFRKTTIDLQQFVPLLHGHRVLAFRALAVFSDASGGQAVPFYLSPTFGGLNVGRGYPTFRFRDRNLLALQAEYRYQVSPLVSGAVFVDAGQVAPSVARHRSGRSSRPPTAPACASAPPAARPAFRPGVRRRRSNLHLWARPCVLSSSPRTLARRRSWLIADVASMRGAAPRFYPDDPLAVDNDRVIDVTDGARDRSRRLLRLPRELVRHARGSVERARRRT